MNSFDETEMKNRKLFPEIYAKYDLFFDKFNDETSYEPAYTRAVFLAAIQVAFVAGYRDGLKFGRTGKIHKKVKA